MSTDSYTGTARRKAQDLFFSSVRFDSRFHQNLSLAYSFSSILMVGKGFLYLCLLLSIGWKT